MKDFKKGGGFKKSYGNHNHFGDDRGERGQKELYQATCSDCGKSCEVPFRPSGGRPVYCRDCFPQHPPMAREEGGFKKPFNKFEHRGERPFRSESSFAPRPPTPDGAMTKQLELLNTKLDRLITIMEAGVTKKKSPVAVAKAVKPAKAAKKPASKKK